MQYNFRFVADMNITAETPDEALRKVALYLRRITTKKTQKIVSLSVDNEVFIVNMNTDECRKLSV